MDEIEDILTEVEKEEFRKLRAGEVPSRNGCSGVTSSITSQWSGSAGISLTGPASQGERNGTVFQSEEDEIASVN